MQSHSNINIKRVSVHREFSRCAKEYDNYNLIQKRAADRVASMLCKKRYKIIWDIGCGTGEMYRSLQKRGIEFEKYIAIDYSQQMLDSHPEDMVVKKRIDFDNKKLLLELSNNYPPQIILSSGALQWSSNIKEIVAVLKSLSKETIYSIFTSGTYANIHKAVHITSPILSTEELITILKERGIEEIDIRNYKIEFDTTIEALRYIKKSGTSGGQRRLTYAQITQLLREQRLKHLEFEVLFAKFSRCR